MKKTDIAKKMKGIKVPKQQLYHESIPFLEKLAAKEPKHPMGSFEDRFKTYMKGKK